MWYTITNLTEFDEFIKQQSCLVLFQCSDKRALMDSLDKFTCKQRLRFGCLNILNICELAPRYCITSIPSLQLFIKGEPSIRLDGLLNLPDATIQMFVAERVQEECTKAFNRAYKRNSTPLPLISESEEAKNSSTHSYVYGLAEFDSDEELFIKDSKIGQSDQTLNCGSSNDELKPKSQRKKSNVTIPLIKSDTY
ncbi:hypothetical protein BC833DRAFT_579415 [Globomyces pollinis-pini]|nr:hypothetical protein BC833DRAFT_579415 [Globomyces pollinis-pini]